ncbi:uncharacterized protein LOC116200633 [Punica granatum]|uniref:Uncharacterized protein LOC116200633 n=2 Tax=Punica granatum TaxID=22663 RepID=A0A6P8D7M3_PUNGR|nr:uncharacterized protein LOC116200633 [Punica granatum]
MAIIPADDLLPIHGSVATSSRKLVVACRRFQQSKLKFLQFGVDQWCHTLVGSFMGKAPEFGKVASVANGLWGKQGRVTVSTMGSLFVFQFLNEEVMTWVLESGPWHVERKYLVLQKWSPQFTEEVLNMRKMPIWVQLRKIPLQYFHPKGISYLVSAIGKPLYMDRATALRSRLDYAKVCIEVEVEKEIPEFLTVDLGDNYTVNVLVDVPWLPEKCDRCKAFGHRCNNAAERPLEAGQSAVSKPDARSCPAVEPATHPAHLVAEKSPVTVTNIFNASSSVQKDKAQGTLSEDLSRGRNQVLTKKQTFADLAEEVEGQENASSSVDEWANASTKEVQLGGKRLPRSASKGVAQVVLKVQGTRKSRSSKGGVGWTAITFVYASNNMLERRVLWQDLQALAVNMRHSWVLMGDFNAVKGTEEVKAVGREVVIDQSMRDFSDFMNAAELIDHTSIGCYFTWSNKRQEGFQVRKIDRVLVNEKWFQGDIASTVEFLPPGISDHCPALLKFGEKENAGPKPFKFFHFWIEHSGYMALVERVWSKTQEGIPMVVLYKKLRFLKMQLKDFNISKFGNVHTQVTDLQNELAQAQATLMESACESPESIKKEMYLRVKLLAALDKEEKLLKQKSRGLIGRKDDYIRGVSASMLSSIFKRKVPASKYQMLLSPIADAEIKEALFSMGNDKSPGPDGFTAFFFKHAWHIVQHDFTKAVQHFFSSGKLRREVNSTIIVLVPKKEKADCMKDFRPISCCNVVYKCITKVLANRLKEVLPDIISLNQTAFVQGRRISDNVLLAHELVRNYHSLEAMGFPPIFLWWIKGCITSPYFSVAINGSLAGYFPGQRGVRQGDPLSPFLFVIAMEVFSQLMDSAAAEGKVGYHPRCKSLQLTHLCFADDLLLFTNGSKTSIAAILDLLNTFYHWSGLKLNPEKSEIFTGGISGESVLDLMTWSGRLQLINSVLFSMASYWCSHFILPKQVVKLVHQKCRSFLWKGLEQHTDWESFDVGDDVQDKWSLDVNHFD